MVNVFLFFFSILFGFLLFILSPKVTHIRPQTKKIAQPTTHITPTPFSFSTENAPSQTLKATVISSTGDVQWQSRTATESAPLTTSILQQGEQLSIGENGKVALK